MVNKNVCALRRGMIAELDTVNQYTKLMAECDDDNTKKIFESIIKEELVHVGEFQYGIDLLCGIQKEKINEGMVEAKEMIFPKAEPLLSI